MLYNSSKVVGKVNRIKELRLKADMKQADLAEALNCTAMTVSRYESGQRDVDSATITKICDIFGCTADYLLGRSPMPSAELTPEEEALLMAWRRCDDRARDIVVVALEPFKKDKSSEKAI